jgi:tetratricopeptide (TPR) repeat protein
MWHVNAADSLSLERDYQDFAIRTGLPLARTEENAKVLNHVKLWLEKHNRFLFIYDNAEGLSNKLLAYLPRGHLQGHILINARHSQVKLSNTELDMDKDFQKFNGATFLLKRFENTQVKINKDNDEVQRLADMLWHLPLALEHAAAYMIKKQETCTGYMKLFKSIELPDLLGDNTFALTGYDKLIATTWKVSIDAIETAGARILFNLCAYFAPENIPLTLFIKGRDKLPVELRDMLLPDRGVKHNRLVGELASYSLLSLSRDDGGNILLSIHRLIQAAVWRNLKEVDEEVQWLTCCFDMVYAVFEYDSGSKVSRDEFVANVSHVLEIAHHAEVVFGKVKDVKEKIAWLYHTVGWGFDGSGQYGEALEWYNKALTIREKVLGKEHPDTATTYNNIANVYYSQGKYEEALEWYNKALTIRE